MKAPESKLDSTRLGLRYKIDQSNLTISHFKKNSIQLFDAAFMRNHWTSNIFCWNLYFHFPIYLKAAQGIISYSSSEFIMLDQIYTEENVSGSHFCGNIAYSLKTKASENFYSFQNFIRLHKEYWVRRVNGFWQSISCHIRGSWISVASNKQCL